MTYYLQKLTIILSLALLKTVSVGCTPAPQVQTYVDAGTEEPEEHIIAHMPLNIGKIEKLELPRYLVQQHLNQEQIANAFLIIAIAKRNSFDSAVLLAIALQESSFDNYAVSPGQDLGLYQISTFWWEAYFNRKVVDFKLAAMDPGISTRFAIEILYLLSTRPACQGKNLFACYNGGAGWQTSKNKDKIIEYRESVSYHYEMIRGEQ